ncbi:Cholesterol 7-alpha-monooxygenase [Madurella mycetomatis]|uniref:Cholesterol 7-alpha-monooxygenase n=1 Tax=Madurella mycetomatis TaxID=100816 RepID=A0A175W2G3_9PEZI|nr:Cholesterol 7-alpha-monooxygenase [Madurella mycetomatis]KXX77745.1 Cholesterol 7-alpha-monooxygenase [Madurella mycetomatis]
MPSTLAVAGAWLVAVYIFLRALLSFTQDPREPQTIENGIPFLSPILAMMSKKAKFYSEMRDKYHLPIYTLRMPGSRIYVVNSTSLIPVVQRQFRVLSFNALEASIAQDVLGVSKPVHEIISRDVSRDEGYLMSFPKYIHPAVHAGPHLDAMNKKAVEVLADSLDKHAKNPDGSLRVKMFQWIRHELMLATTDSVYGPHNPFRDPKMEEAWFKFEPKIIMFALKMFPPILAKEAYRAREFMVKVWERYFAAEAYKHGSKLVQTRTEINEDFEIPLMQTARIEVGGGTAILSNTLPSTFWMIFHIYSNPTVLQDIRDEVSKGVTTAPDGTQAIDLAFVKGSCPVLLSTFQEVFRVNSIGVSTRFALEDHLLDGKYLLKKGSTVMIPAHVQHSDPQLWGETVHEFDHKRFLRGSGKRHNPIAWRGFGGGTTLCPGRHFATTEILLFSALMVLRFDVHPVRGEWVKPSVSNTPLVAAMPAPDFDLEVEIRPRDDSQWKVTFSGYDKDLQLSAEDIRGEATQ